MQNQRRYYNFTNYPNPSSVTLLFNSKSIHLYSKRNYVCIWISHRSSTIPKKKTKQTKCYAYQNEANRCSMT